MKLQSLVAQVAYWRAVSEKDSDPFTALLHSSYALAFASSTLQLLSEREASILSKEDMGELFASIKKLHAANILAVNGAHSGPSIDPALALIQPLA
jgi:hypothetical protein